MMKDKWLIRKRGMYYRPNAQGYTSDIRDAGRYTEAEAIAHRDASDPGEITIIPEPKPVGDEGIPLDIMTTAMHLAAKVYNETVDSDDDSHSMDMYPAATIIGRAIFAERERCARLADMHNSCEICAADIREGRNA